jgi:hypothetical protein
MLLLPTHFIQAQYQLEIIDQPVEARQLDGYVRIASDQQGVPNVHVDECDHAWKQVLNSTVTDKDGHFHLKPKAQGAIHYIRISSLGFNPRLYTVRLSKHGSPTLDLEINVST